MSISKLLLETLDSQDYLYHFTDINALYNILKTDVIRRGVINIALESYGDNFDSIRNKIEAGESLSGVSFTRDKNLNWDKVALVFDRRKINHNHKIYPLRTHQYEGKDQFKEEVIIKDLKNVKRLLEFVYLGHNLDDRNNEKMIKTIQLLHKENIFELHPNVDFKIFTRRGFEYIEDTYYNKLIEKEKVA